MKARVRLDRDADAARVARFIAGRAIRASISLPAVFPPTVGDAALLVDGGVLAPAEPD